MINTTLQLTSYLIPFRRTQITVQIFDTSCFCVPFGGLGTTYTVHLGLIGKLGVDFLFVLIDGTFSLSVTAEVLRAKIDLKSAFLKGVGQFRPNFHVVGDAGKLV